MEALKVTGLSKEFGGIRALKNVSFSIQTGEHLAIIGPNGAGKTTLLNILSGQITATSGRIYLFGRDITRMVSYRRAHLGLSRSFQVISLFPNLTVLHNALLSVLGTQPSPFQLLHSVTAHKPTITKVRELLEAMNLWERRDAIVKELGYGEQRRLEITLSLASKPRILLLDEPSCGLTMAECTDMINMISNISKNISVVMIAHDMDLVFGLAHRILVLYYGEVIADGVPEEIQANLRVREVYMGADEIA